MTLKPNHLQFSRGFEPTTINSKTKFSIHHKSFLTKQVKNQIMWMMRVMFEGTYFYSSCKFSLVHKMHQVNLIITRGNFSFSSFGTWKYFNFGFSTGAVIFQLDALFLFQFSILIIIFWLDFVWRFSLGFFSMIAGKFGVMNFKLMGFSFWLKKIIKNILRLLHGKEPKSIFQVQDRSPNFLFAIIQILGSKDFDRAINHPNPSTPWRLEAVTDRQTDKVRTIAIFSQRKMR